MACQLMLLRFSLLQTDDIGALLTQPGESAFARSGTDSIGIQSDDAHGGMIATCSLINADSSTSP
jgi:hypothetical protein